VSILQIAATDGAVTRLVVFIAVGIAATIAFYPDHGILFSLGISAGLRPIPLMLALPISLCVAAGFTLGARFVGFLLLMFGASIAYLPIIAYTFSIAQPPSWLKFFLLLVLPGFFIVGAGYALGVLSKYRVFVRCLVFSIAGVALPPVAIYVSWFLWVLAFGE